MFSRLREVLKIIYKRLFVLYLVVFFLIYFIVDWKKMTAHAKATTLSRLMPTYDYLVAYIEGQEPFDRVKLEEYEYYYERLLDSLQWPDIQGMMGFCHYHLGHEKLAIKAYKRAIQINPNYFAFHYNLGLIYFKKGLYEEAIKNVLAALETDWEYNLHFIHQSKTYLPILKRTGKLESEVVQRLQKGYYSCYTILVLSYYYLKKYPQMFYVCRDALEHIDGEEKKRLFYFYSALASYQLKEYKKSIFFLQEYISFIPDDPDAFNYMGLSFRALGMEPLAQKALTQAALFKDREDPKALVEHGLTLHIF